MIESELVSIWIFLVITILQISQEKIFFFDSVLRTNPWTDKNKDLN